MCIDDREQNFRSLSQRLRTFSNWSRIQTPESLAIAGFFRIKDTVDEVQCFNCGIRIFDWEPHDNPLSEHLRLSSKCRFANLLKSIQIREELFEKIMKFFEEIDKFKGVGVAGNGSVTLFEKIMKLFEEINKFKGVDVAGNGSVTKETCSYCKRG